jgi:hypothetical protein
MDHADAEQSYHWRKLLSTCFEGLDHTDYRGKSGVKAHTPDVDLVLEVLAKGWRRFTHNALVNRPSW